MLVFAQKGVSVSLVSIDASERSASFWKGINKTYQEKDSASVLLLAKQIQLKAINKGFIASQYRVIQKDSANYQIQVQLGDQYRWIQLKANPLYRDILFKAGYKSIDYANQPIKFSKLENIFEKALQICDNTGHPFADIRLDSINIDGPKVSGFIRLELNQFIKIDSIIIKGNSRISPYFINNYLGIKAGRAYQESKIVAIESRLKELPYIKSIKPYEFTFTPATSKLVLYLDNKKANQFDGVLGFLPNERTGKIEFTGQAHL
ncbi:MAG: POTRA domain-containing protein, partial [Bacteroidota bacterium]